LGGVGTGRGGLCAITASGNAMAMAINKKIFFIINNYSVSYSRGLLKKPGDLPWRLTPSD
jgi:hypothetical protein